MKNISWIIVIGSVLGLIFIRVLEEKLFYDPFLHYFKTKSHNGAFPEFVWGKLIISHWFRFGLNLCFSLLIIHFLFKRKVWTIQAALMILLVFLVTLPIYLYCIGTEFRMGHLFSFYVRRFVIQPMMVLFIVPLYYYRKHLEKINA